MKFAVYHWTIWNENRGCVECQVEALNAWRREQGISLHKKEEGGPQQDGASNHTCK